MAIGRARYSDVAFNATVGSVATERTPNPTVKIYLAGTGTPGTDSGTALSDTIYQAGTGVATYTNPITGDAYGGFEFFLLKPQRLKIVVTGGSHTLVADYVEAHADPADTLIHAGEIDIRYFGIVGDDTDEATKWQAALDYVGPLKLGLWCPPPPVKYAWGTVLTSAYPVKIRGVFNDIDTDGTGSGSEGTIFHWLGANNGVMLYIAAAAGSVVTGSRIEGVVFDGFVSNSVVAGVAIYAKGVKLSKFRHLRVRNVTQYGIWLDDNVTGSNGAITSNNTIEDYDFVHGFWTGAAMIGANASALYLHGLSLDPSLGIGGVTKNTIRSLTASIYNGHAVLCRFTDGNIFSFVHAIPKAATVDYVAGTGSGAYLQAASTNPADLAYGFPAGNEFHEINGDIRTENHVHNNNIPIRHSSEGGAIVITAGGHMSYVAQDYLTGEIYQTARYPMTHEADISATSMQPLDANATKTNYAGLIGCISMPSSANGGAASWLRPTEWNNGTIYNVRLHCTVDAAESGKGVVFRARVKSYAAKLPGATPSTITMPTGTTGTLSPNNAASQLLYLDIPISIGHTLGDDVYVSVTREPADAADTFTSNAILLGVTLSFAATGPATGTATPYTPAPPAKSPF